MTINTQESTEILELGGYEFTIQRPHRFGLVILGLRESLQAEPTDYLHDILLDRPNREPFFQLIDRERLVVCKNVPTADPSYRKVRGKSSFGRLSQAEYYHHDGCSCPEKPRINEIRLPHQSVNRQVATSVAPFGDVVKAQLDALPERMQVNPLVVEYQEAFRDKSNWPAVESWDKIQGYVTRMVRKEMDAEAAREYFRHVDRLAAAYDLPWEMGESRLMLNNHSDLTRTVQHRRAFQKPKQANEQNGRLVKRWTARDYLPSGIPQTRLPLESTEN